MALTGIELASSVLITTVSPVDVKYGPFEGLGIAAAKTLALSEVVSNLRYKGLTVGLVDTTSGGTTIVEYWFESGILDADLVLKSSGTTVVANPGSTTGTLTSITIGSVNYAVASGGVGGSGTVGKIPKWGSTTTSLTDSVITESSSNIGIGTTSPGAKLEVNDSSDNLQMRLGSLTAGTSPYFRLQGKNTAGNTNYYADIELDAENGKLIFNDPGTSSGSIGQSPMVLDSSGNVGIGTTSPDGLLHVSAGTSGDAKLILEADTDNSDENDVPQIWFKADGDITEGLIGLNNNYLDFVSNVSTVNGFRFFTGSTSNTGTTDPYTNATEKIRITVAGDVGIGTTSPGEKLEVAGKIKITGTANFIDTTRNASSQANYVKFNDSFTSSVEAYLGFTSNNRDFKINSANGNGTITLQAGGGTAVHVDSSQNVGVGTTVPGAKLDVADASPVIRITNTQGALGNGTVGSFDFFTKDTSTNASRVLSSIVCDNLAGSTIPGGELVFKTSTGGASFTQATEKMRIISNGNVGVGTTVPTKKLEVNGDFSARNIESIGNNTGITFPAVLGWYRIMEWGGSSRGGTVVKLSTTGNLTGPTTYVINAFKTYGDPATTNTLKLEQYGNISYLTKARIATDSVTNVTYLEVYLNGLGSGSTAVPMMVFHDSLLGYDNNTIVYDGTVTLAPATSDVQEELPFVHEGTSVEKLYADNVNLLNLQVDSAQGNNGDVLTSTGSGVGWTQPQTGTNVVANPGNAVAGLETITIGSTNYGVGTVLGSGTQNRVTKWSAGGSGIEDSEITDTGTNITLGESQPLYSNTLQLETVSGVAILPAYGRGVINGYPASSNKLNLKMSTGFNNAGTIVDSYIYDTFEVTIAALESLGDTPLTGQVLVDTPNDLTCLLADFWFYRKIDNSDIGNWGDGTELVIYPSNDLSGQTIASPYEQGYFRVTHDFLSTAAVNGKSSASSGLYQGNINGIDQGGMNGAWQIGDNAPPLGNKVYLSLSTGQPAPTFASGSQTRFFIGLKYRFLSFQHGVEDNQDLITIDVAGPVDVEIYQKCDEATGEDNCDEMPYQINLPIGTGGGNFIIIQEDATGRTCCYFKQDTGVLLPDSGFTPIGSFSDCDELPVDCTK